jgi:hypothetical protein
MAFTKIYLSVPVELSNRQNVIDEIGNNMANYKEATGNTPGVGYYKPGQMYDKTIISECDVFVFTDIAMPWRVTIGLLPSGVRNELKIAMSLHKPIYYIYKNKDGEINLYKCHYDPTNLLEITPIAGSSSYIYQFLTELSEGKKEDTFSVKTVEKITLSSKKQIDRRLLL